MGKVKLPPIIKHVYLMTTEYCPCRCEYCYIKNRGTKNYFPYESMEIIKNMFTCQEKPRIVFFGGEPLANYDLVKKVVENYKNDFIFQVVTNCMVNFEKFMEEVYEPNRNNFDVQVSWDGDKNTRPLLSGNRTSETVYEKIVKQLSLGRILIGRAVIDDNSVQRLYQTYLKFKDLNEKYQFGYDFTIAHQPKFSNDYYLDLGKNLSLIYNDMRKNIGKQFLPPFLVKTITNILKGDDVQSCDIGNYIVIRPNGDVYPCTILSQIGEEFKLGSIYKSIDTELCSELHYETSCKKDCQLKMLCDGGCRYERIHNFGHNWKNEICEHTCKIYKVVYDETVSFLKSLTKEENELLKDYLLKYDMYMISYDNNRDLEYNNQERIGT